MYYYVIKKDYCVPVHMEKIVLQIYCIRTNIIVIDKKKEIPQCKIQTNWNIIKRVFRFS